jgi:hypothetical protein
MSLQWIRDNYGVPAKRGGQIIFEWPPEAHRPGTIVGSTGPHLKVRLVGDKHTSVLHPTWNVTYLDTNRGDA